MLVPNEEERPRATEGSKFQENISVSGQHRFSTSLVKLESSSVDADSSSNPKRECDDFETKQQHARLKQLKYLAASCCQLRCRRRRKDDQRRKDKLSAAEFAALFDENSDDGNNKVGYIDLYRHATKLERLACAAGVCFMWFAATWQPISVYILALMASLIGDYSMQTTWFETFVGSGLDGGGAGGHQHQSSPAESTMAAWLGSAPRQLRSVSSAAAASIAHSNNNNNTVTTTWPGLIWAEADGDDAKVMPASAIPLLSPIAQFIASPIFEHACGQFAGYQPPVPTNRVARANRTRAALQDVSLYLKTEFLRKSFEINGSAFILALAQLLAFFFGLVLITRAASAQAARIKTLYFKSCLSQEVTWFESSLDSASGSASSLNALVDKYEDGVGAKFALLVYFLGHVALFALSAFYEYFELAAFCMSFVVCIAISIGYVSELQATSIGKQNLFAKHALELAEEILAAIRTVFAFNGETKELERYTKALKPVNEKAIVRHLYTAMNTSLSKFSIFACFGCYCFYAMRLLPPYSNSLVVDKATILWVLRGAEVSIVNILISIPFMEALQQSKGSIARVYAAIERRSKIDPSSRSGLKLAPSKWRPSISFRMVQFAYVERQRLHLQSPFFGCNKGAQGASTSGGSAGTGGCCTPSPPDLDGRQSPLDELVPANLHQVAAAAAVAAAQQQQADAAKELLQSELSIGLPKKNMQQQGHRILNYLNLDIGAGKTVALVGPSGSGKSTVLALVQRLYDISGGQLLIGDTPIASLNIGWLREQIGVVTQEPRLFDMSIADNIKLGLPQSSANNTEDDLGNNNNEAVMMQQVINAARAANAHDFIMRLPDRYQTKVGGSGGVQLSGGQKQRIAIARALIRQPKILLLDESTSALDTESEAQVQRALQTAAAGRTTIIVAHRFAAIKNADIIVVMHQGRVVEQGSHDELMALGKRSIYRRMYEAQISSSSSSNNKAGDDKTLMDETQNDLSNLSDKASGCYSTKTTAALPPQTVANKHNNNNNNNNNNNIITSLTMSLNDVVVGDNNKPIRKNNEGRNKRNLDNKNHGYDYDDDYDDDNGDDGDDNDDDDDDDDGSGSSKGSRASTRMSLWHFVEMPKWSFFAAFVVCLAAGLILPLNLIAHSYLFSAFAYASVDEIGGHLYTFGLLIISCSTLVFVVSFLQVLLPGYVGEKLAVRLRFKMLDSLLKKPMVYFDIDTNSAGALCDRFNAHITNVQSIAGARIATIVESLATLCAGAVFGFGQNFALSSFCLTFALIVLATTIIESRIVGKEANLRRKYDAQLAQLTADSLSNMKTIASLHRQDFFINKFAKIVERRQVCLGWRLTTFRAALTSIKFVMPAISWSASMYFACNLLVNKQIDLQSIFVVCPVVLFALNDTFRALVFFPELLTARKSLRLLRKMHDEFSPDALKSLTFLEQLQAQEKLHATRATPVPSPTVLNNNETENENERVDPSSNRLTSLSNNKRLSFMLKPTIQENNEQRPPAPFSRRISNAFDLPAYMHRKSSRLHSVVSDRPARGRLDFRNVCFAYPSRPSALVLDGFTLSVAAGESVALVGSSGSGKSTCISILEKFYDFHAGTINVDGRDLRLVDCNWMRSQIGLVSQEPTMLSYTISDNIRYGDNSRTVSFAEVVCAAKAANVHDFIMSLPDGYETVLSGPMSSSGSQLSGGQRQRIAIARALIRDAPILICDEATSALDARNEVIVQDALNRARRGKTTLTIAHRLATIKDYDRIVVVMNGRVVEQGTHDDLLALPNGHYARLWARQELAASTPSSSSSSPSSR